MKLDHAGHCAVAAALARGRAVIVSEYYRLQSKLGKTRAANEKFNRTLRALDSLRSVLDTEYHRVTSEEQFAIAGHVYYKDAPPGASPGTDDALAEFWPTVHAAERPIVAAYTVSKPNIAARFDAYMRAAHSLTEAWRALGVCERI